VVLFGGKLLCLNEAGPPWAVDPATLDTIECLSYDGLIPSTDRFLAHTRYDAKRDRLVGMCMQNMPAKATFHEFDNEMNPLSSIAHPLGVPGTRNEELHYIVQSMQIQLSVCVGPLGSLATYSH
jgi:carotenoid cleavage dioxygenase-like enzyme